MDVESRCADGLSLTVMTSTGHQIITKPNQKDNERCNSCLCEDMVNERGKRTVGLFVYIIHIALHKLEADCAASSQK